MKFYKKIGGIFLILSALYCNSARASLYWNIESGIKEYEKSNFSFAKNYFIQYTNNNPNDKDGYLWLGKTYLKLKDKKNAIENFEKLYQLYKNENDIENINFKNKINDSNSEYQDLAKSNFDKGKYKDAEFYADKILENDPMAYSALFIKARIAHINKNNDLAREYLKRAIIFDNKLLKTNLAKTLNIVHVPEPTEKEYATLVYNSYFTGDTEKAIHYLKAYLQKNNTDVGMYNLLCDLYLSNNSKTEALNTLIEAKKLNEKNIKSYLTEAKLKPENEEELLKKAYEINPNNQEVLLNLGNYYLKKEDYKNSEKYFSILVNINDGLYEGYFGYIYSLIENNEIDEAVKLIRKASSINPNVSELDILLAKICIIKDEYKEALEYTKEALKKDKNPDYYLISSELNYILGNYNASIQAIAQTLRIPYQAQNPKKLQELYVKNYLKKEYYKDVEKYIDNNEKLDKNSLLYKYILYKLYKYKNKDDKANQLYTKISKFKPSTKNDYLIFSEILFEEKNKQEAIDFLDGAIKKKPEYSALFERQKNKLEFMSNKK